MSINQFCKEYLLKSKEFYPLAGTKYENDNNFINFLDKNNIAKVEKFYQEQLSLLHKIDNIDDKITYQMLELDLKNRIEGLQQKIAYFLPINQIFSWHLDFLVLGSGTNDHIFKTTTDYENWFLKMNTFYDFLNSIILVIQEGITEKITLQKSLVIRTIPQFKKIATTPLIDNPLYLSIKMLDKNDEISTKDKQEITQKYSTIITEKILPMYNKIADFLEKDYLPFASKDTGMSQFAGGKEYYQFMIKAQAETDLSPEKIHELGLKEVEKINQELQKYKNNKPVFFKTEQQILDYLSDISKIVDQNVAKLFNNFPKTPLIIKQVEKYRESGASPHYMPGDLTKNRPGIYYVPIPDATEMSIQNSAFEATFVHEATPGHHYQISLAQENTEINQFRRDFFSTAMGEGWALYTETLGKELGLYTNDLEYAGYLEMSMMRAIRLVVDTGLHAKNWSKEEAIEYSKKYLTQSHEEIENSIERYMALPAQALAYKIGYFKIIGMLKDQKQKLGDKFDIKKFHDNLLKHGSVPLSIWQKLINQDI